MVTITKLKYSKNRIQNEIKALIFFLSILFMVISCIAFFSFRKLLIYAGIVLLEYLVFSIPYGRIIIKSSEGNLFLEFSRNFKRNKIYKVASHKFRWSYNFMEMGAGGEAGRAKTTHSSFIFLRVEFQLEKGANIILVRELYPWSDFPEGWEYEFLEERFKSKILLTPQSLRKLKRRIQSAS